MSYCRWSSDGFRSDLYVYASVGDFWSVNVAGGRHVGLDTLPPNPYSGESMNELRDKKITSEEWKTRYKTYHEAFDKLEIVPIDLPYAGESFACATPQEAAHKLIELKELGYHIPEGVIEILMEEVEDNESE